MFGRLAAGADKGFDAAKNNEAPSTPVHRRGRGTFHRPDEDRTLHWEDLDTLPQRLPDGKIPTAGKEWTKRAILGDEESKARSPLAPIASNNKAQLAQRKKKNGKEGGGGTMEAAVARLALVSIANDEAESSSSKRRRRREKSKTAAIDGVQEQPLLQQQNMPRESRRGRPKFVKPTTPSVDEWMEGRMTSSETAVPTPFKGVFSSPAKANSPAKTPPTLEQWLAMQKQKKASTAVAAPRKENDVFSFKLTSLSTQQQTPSAAKPSLVELITTVVKGQGTLEVKPSLAAPEPETTAEIRESEVSALETLKLDGFFACKKETVEKREAAAPSTTPKFASLFANKTDTVQKRESSVASTPARIKFGDLFSNKSTADKREVKTSLVPTKAAEPAVAKQTDTVLFGVKPSPSAPVESAKPATSGWGAAFMRMMEKANAAKAAESAPRAEESMRRSERV